MAKKYKRKGLSKKKLLSLVREEQKTAKEYAGWGFKKQGLQEAQHAKFFEKEARRL